MDIIEQIKASAATVKQLAALSGIDFERIYKWKQGKSLPNSEDLERISGVFQQISNKSKLDIKKMVSDKIKKDTGHPTSTEMLDAMRDSGMTIEDLKNTTKDIPPVNKTGTIDALQDVHTQTIANMPYKLLEEVLRHFMEKDSNNANTISSQADTINTQAHTIKNLSKGDDQSESKRKAG